MLRTYKERFAQSISFEAGGLLLSLPFLAFFSEGSLFEDFWLLVCITLAVLNWTPFHNLAFDRLDLHLTGRVASERPQFWRVVHAITHEATSMLVSLPILIWVGGMELKTALIVDVGLTAIYIAWAYVFHLVWDLNRPIKLEPLPPTAFVK